MKTEKIISITLFSLCFLVLIFQNIRLFELDKDYLANINRIRRYQKKIAFFQRQKLTYTAKVVLVAIIFFLILTLIVTIAFFVQKNEKNNLVLDEYQAEMTQITDYNNTLKTNLEVADKKNNALRIENMELTRKVEYLNSKNSLKKDSQSSKNKKINKNNKNKDLNLKEEPVLEIIDTNTNNNIDNNNIDNIDNINETNNIINNKDEEKFIQ